MSQLEGDRLGLHFPEVLAMPDGSVIVVEMLAPQLTRVSPTAPARPSPTYRVVPTVPPSAPTARSTCATTVAASPT